MYDKEEAEEEEEEEETRWNRRRKRYVTKRSVFFLCFCRKDCILNFIVNYSLLIQENLSCLKLYQTPICFKDFCSVSCGPPIMPKPNLIFNL